MKKHFSSIVVSIVILLEILFVIAVFVASANDVQISNTLITYWHITFLGELFACAGIKVSKVLAAQIDENDGDEGEIMG